MKLDSFLRTMITKGASDLHVKVGMFPHIRVHGDLVPVTEFGKTSKEDSLLMSFAIMTNKQKQKFRDRNQVDLSHEIQGLGRFRINVFQQRGTPSIAVRAVPNKILDFDSLNLPKVLERICREPRGLVLVTGTTGSGKSTTLASMINYINSRETRHIITIEDPIEFQHGDRMSIISQREVSVDTPDFSSALRSSLRQDPDVLLVGEMRDLETMETAIIAAETGHLVFSTLHTLDALETINRIVTVFPTNQQRQIRLQLAMVLRAVVSMRLIKRSDTPGRVPAVEAMLITEHIRNCIMEPDKTRLILEAISLGTSEYGMQTFDQSVYEHYHAGRISYEDALSNATNPDDFRLRVEGISTTKDSAIEAMQRELANQNK